MQFYQILKSIFCIYSWRTIIIDDLNFYGKYDPTILIGFWKYRASKGRKKSKGQYHTLVFMLTLTGIPARLIVTLNHVHIIIASFFLVTVWDTRIWDRGGINVTAMRLCPAHTPSAIKTSFKIINFGRGNSTVSTKLTERRSTIPGVGSTPTQKHSSWTAPIQRNGSARILGIVVGRAIISTET